MCNVLFTGLLMSVILVGHDYDCHTYMHNIIMSNNYHTMPYHAMSYLNIPCHSIPYCHGMRSYVHPYLYSMLHDMIVAPCRLQLLIPSLHSTHSTRSTHSTWQHSSPSNPCLLSSSSGIVFRLQLRHEPDIWAAGHLGGHRWGWCRVHSSPVVHVLPVHAQLVALVQSGAVLLHPCKRSLH